MKKKLKLFALLGLFLSPSMMYAAYASKFKLTNFKQVDETSLTFDLELHNTGDVAFGLDAAQCKIVYSQGIYGVESANIAQIRAVSPLSTDLVGWYGGDGLVAPTLLSQIMTVTGNPGYIVFVTNALPNVDYSEVDLFQPGAYKKLATIKVLFTTGSGPAIRNRPFEEVVHGLSFDANMINHTVNRVNTYDALSTPGKVYKIGLIPAFSQMPQPAIENLPSNTANRVLARYCFTGTGDYTNVNRWNNATTASITGYHVAPSITSNVNIAGNCVVSTNNTAVDLTINSGAQLTLNNGSTLSATKLYVNSDSVNGTGTFVDMNVDGGLNVSGTTDVHQFISRGRNWYVSSPLSGATSGAVAATALNPLYYYNETASNWPTISNTTTPLDVMKGYVTKVPYSGNLMFTGGSLNTGPKTYSPLTSTGTTKTGFNLVGNPYASFVDWESALSNVNTANLMTSIWYRTKNGSNAYIFDTYSATTHIGTSNNGTAVTKYIPPMQAFWVRTTTGTGALGFDNNMRSHQNQSLSTIRLRSQTTENVSQHILRLQVSNGKNSDETIVLFDKNASDGYDVYDTPKMSNDNPAIPELYTLAGKEKIVINGLNIDGETEELPLGFSTGVSNNFTIKATEISNFEPNYKIFLKDSLMDVEQELTTMNDYSFSSNAVNTSSRFTIEFRKSIPTQINNSINNQSVNIYKNSNDRITISRTGNQKEEGIVSVYNTMGQLIISKTMTESITVIEQSFDPGIYIVNVNYSGVITTKKLVFN